MKKQEREGEKEKEKGRKTEGVCTAHPVSWPDTEPGHPIVLIDVADDDDTQLSLLATEKLLCCCNILLRLYSPIPPDFAVQ